MLYDQKGRKVTEKQADKMTDEQRAKCREVHEIAPLTEAPKGFFSIEARANLK